MRQTMLYQIVSSDLEKSIIIVPKQKLTIEQFLQMAREGERSA